MSGGYDDKSPAMPVPGPMVAHIHIYTHCHFTVSHCDAVSDLAFV